MSNRSNDDVAAALGEYADLLAITGEPYRARAYERAARAVAGHHVDVATLDSAALRDIPGVGASIAGKVAEITTAGRLHAADELRSTIPDELRH